MNSALQLSDISKSFGDTVALRAASLSVAEREIHALVGENGAGKSTLMRIAAGLERPDHGNVEYFGRLVTGWSPRQALAAGVGMVHQHFTLVSSLTTLENLMLGHEPRRGPLGIAVDRVRALAEARTLIEEAQLEVPLEAPVGTLSVGQAQRVEILKALARRARLLICDEPTAVLTPLEVAELWSVLRRIRERGTTIILISHKLDEVMAISDAVTVLRGGRTVVARRTRQVTSEELATAVVGGVHPRAPDHLSSTRPSKTVTPLLAVSTLRVRGVGREDALRDVSFSVAAGEVLGIAGVDGNGQTELVEAIAGLRPVTEGSVLLEGDDVTRATVRARLDRGLALIPEDRQRRGLVLDYAVEDNLILDQVSDFTRGATLDRRRVRQHAIGLMNDFAVTPRDPSSPARVLSGGNQQKVVIARELGRRSSLRVLIAAHPTRGVDLGATEMIHQYLRAARDDFCALVLVSADLNELLALSDRIAVMYRGRFALTLDARGASLERLGRAMMGLPDFLPSEPSE